jgi:[ribosomal protein S5]-alanine N-acetyltransferase
MNIFAETERLILREVLPEDDAAFFELDSDPEVHRYLGDPVVEDIETCRKVIQFVRQQYIDNGIGRWAVIEKNENRFIGWAGLKFLKEEMNGHINYYDVGYRLIRKYWGKGYGTEACLASLAYGFEHMNLPAIYAVADVDNQGSNHILRKCGLVCTGAFEHEHMRLNWYEIKKETWGSLNK